MGKLDICTTATPKLFSIVEFLEQCSRPEFGWLIDESSQQVAGLIVTATDAERSHDPELSIYISNFSPANIHVDRAKRQIVFPAPVSGRHLECVASFFAGFIIEGAKNDAFANKACRMRAIIAAAIAADGIYRGANRRVLREKDSTVQTDSRCNQIRKAQRSLVLRHSSSFYGHQWTGLPNTCDDRINSDNSIFHRPIDAATSSTPLPEATVVTRPPRSQAMLSGEGPLSTLVIPSAGRSSRFPGHKPKWLLTMPNGRLMVVAALAKLNFSRVQRVVLGILKEHVDRHCNSDISALIRAFEDGPTHLSAVELSIVIIERETADQVQTIECILKTANVTGPIFLKDCDNQFSCDVPGIDGIAILEITKDMQNLNIPAGKSYVAPNCDGNIDNIVEKVILGPHFCVGGYSFASAEDFIDQVVSARYYQTVMSASNIELAVSDLVWLKLISSRCLCNIESPSDHVAEFATIAVSQYEDWGTLQAWEAYARTFRTLFVDIDGTLIKNSGGYFKPIWGEQPPLQQSVARLQALHKKGRTQIILTTSRPESFREPTVKQLERHSVPYDQIIFGMLHAQRIIINDYAKTNPFPSAAAINLRRDSDELAEMLGMYSF